MMSSALGNLNAAFCDALGVVPPVGKNWTVHASIRSVGRDAEGTFQVWGGHFESWSIHLRTFDGESLIEEGTLHDGSPSLDVPLPSSPLEVPQFLVAFAAAHGIRWDLATTRCGGNRVLAKQLRGWIEATLAADASTG